MYRPEPIDSLRRTRAKRGPAEKVLVVIPCLNERVQIKQLVSSLIEDSPGTDMLVVAADGGSSDGTLEILQALANANPSVRVIANRKRLQSAGVNLAAKTFGEGRRWMVRVDAHADYPKGYVASLIDEARRTGASSVVVSMRSSGRACFQRAAAVAQNSVLGAGGAAHRRSGKAEFVDHGHHALFDLPRFLAVGGYDENMSHNEDAEFDVRLMRAGGKIWLTRSVDVVYFPREHPTELFQQYRNYGRGRANTILRHNLRPKMRQMLPACVLPALLGVALSPWLPLGFMPALFWIIACLLFGAVLGVKQGRRCALASGIAAMIIHLGWSVGFWSEMTRFAMSRIGNAMKHEPPTGMARP